MVETLTAKTNRTGTSPEAIVTNYDTSNEFFRLWIGPELIYSCALFEDGDDLARAQIRKLDHHIAAAGADGASRVLEIGCGWGALMRRLVTRFGVERVVGLTLNPAQARWIEAHPTPGVEVRVEDWRDHKAEEPYDAIISVAALETFVRRGTDPAEKMRVYRAFFDFCHRMLVDDGRLSIQTIACVKPSTPIPAEISPESELPLISEPIAAAEEKFELLALRNDSDHYYGTLRIWDDNLAACHERAAALVGEATVTDLRQYLRSLAAGFERGQICLLRMSFLKR